MSEEINALIANSTWILVPKSAQANIVGCKWIYLIKRKSDGSVERYKVTSGLGIHSTIWFKL